MKTTFNLEYYGTDGDTHVSDTDSIDIIGTKPANRPYVSISFGDQIKFIQDKDLERFAVNVLKALKSKHLKP